MRIQSIDTLKGLAIMAVVVIHTEPFLANKAIETNWYYVGETLQQISSFAIPFFFIAAGYFFTRGVEKDGLPNRWWQYTSRLFTLLLIWILVDGIFWGDWLEEILRARSLSPLLWNLHAIPAFAAGRPDLFFFRGTAVPLWFLVSLIVAISWLAACLKLFKSPTVLLASGCCAYGFSLLTSAYADTRLGIGLNLPLEQRGPLIAFSFLTLGTFFATRSISVPRITLILVIGACVVFGESALLSYLSGMPFQERPYLFSTPILAGSMFLYALQNPTLGTTSIIAKIGNRSLGIYLVHTPVLGALDLVRNAVIHPIWEMLFPIILLAVSYALVNVLVKVPYVRLSVL